ncbi:MAG: Ig-like domain-containing protein [Actinobacteria bacterium]|nr:Ig-like domain-containing protein [Actinomycetota bacterium]
MLVLKVMPSRESIRPIELFVQFATFAAILLSTLFWLPGTAFATPSLNLSPLGGASGTGITVTGSGFVAGQAGSVWFDANGDGIKDPAESQSSVTTDGFGNFSTALTVPGVAPGYYPIRVDIPGGGIIEGEALFIVRNPSLTLGTTSGPPGRAVIVTGRYFAPGRAGWVWFDTNNNYIKDPGEPAMQVTSNSYGGFYASITVPNVAAGAYPVRADLPEGAYVEGEAIFTAIPSINLNPTSGSPGTFITVTGSGFEANKPGWVWFDANKNGVRDTGEPTAAVTSDAFGRIIVALPSPTGGLPPGSYPVRVDLPAGNAVTPTQNFMVKGSILALSARKGIPGGTINAVGSRFPSNTSGWVWFDANKNGVRDTDEFYKKVTTNAHGGFVTSLTIPKVAAGTYPVLADIPGGGFGAISASIVILAEPTLSLSVNSGAPGTILIVNGRDFKVWSSGRIWFDINGNGKKDANEPSRSVKTDSFGKFRATLTVPDRVRRGAYAVYADIPAWGRPEAVADFFVTTNRPSDDLTGDNPDVSMATPPDGAVNVHRYPSIRVTFDTRIIKGPDFSSITLSDEDGNVVRAGVRLWGKMLRIRPTGILKRETTYVLTIPAEAVSDTKGKGLDEDFILTFTTKR